MVMDKVELRGICKKPQFKANEDSKNPSQMTSD